MKFIAVLLMLVFSSSYSFAAILCAPHDIVVLHLEDRYKESSVAIGVASNGHLVEVFASSKGYTWTLLLTDPNGITCMMAAGDNWQTFNFPVEDKKL